MIKINRDALVAVIDYLVARHPNELPRGVTTLEQLHLKIGQQQVIETLREYLEHLEASSGKS